MTVMDRPELPLTDAEPTLPLERAPRMILEICRGRTQFPRRPISGPSYFIGSGANCDLRLGGPDFPEIHSLIQTRENGIWFETLTDAPLVMINGEATHGEWLRDGDRIEIGVFQFLAHLLPILPPVAVNSTSQFRAQIVPLTELSAEELADCLQEDMSRIEETERGLRAGSQALLHALRRHSEQSACTTMPFVPAPVTAASLNSTITAAQHEFQTDLDRLCKDLEELTLTLERRSDTISQREIRFAQATEALLESQRQLVSQLETALEHATELAAAREIPKKPTIRVSA